MKEGKQGENALQCRISCIVAGYEKARERERVHGFDHSDSLRSQEKQLDSKKHDFVAIWVDSSAYLLPLRKKIPKEKKGIPSHPNYKADFSYQSDFFLRVLVIADCRSFLVDFR